MEKKINNNFNKKFNFISKYFNPKKDYTIEFIDNKTMIFLQKDKKILKASYNFYGIIKDNNMIWGTSIPLVKKKLKEHIGNIRNKKNEFYQDYIKTQNELSYFYYSILDNDMTILTNDDMIEKINKLILYLSDDCFIFNPININNSTQLITINNILELYV
tara:strand:- start:4262 stop:4741 length:480 start_codon:yes stop_codon:yes gene_type:complete